MFNTALLGSRLLVAQILLGAAVTKMLQPEATLRLMEAHRMPFTSIAMPSAVALELGGGLALLLGWQTRIAAGALCVYVALATSIFHTEFNNPDQLDLFSKDLAIIGGLLALAVTGAGSLSLDQLAGRSGSTPVSSTVRCARIGATGDTDAFRVDGDKEVWT